jgi:hypothetical protein
LPCKEDVDQIPFATFTGRDKTSTIVCILDSIESLITVCDGVTKWGRLAFIVVASSMKPVISCERVCGVTSGCARAVETSPIVFIEPLLARFPSSENPDVVPEGLEDSLLVVASG